MNSGLAMMPVLIIIPLLAFMVPVLFRLLKPCQPSELTVEWFESFQIASYKPMQGLLAPDDFQFLSRQPGFDSALFRKLRQDRLRIFRGYLNNLILDFNRLYAMAQHAISRSHEDQSELFSQVLALRLRFWLAILQVESTYLLCRFGLCQVSVENPVRRLEDMSRYLTSLPQTRAFLVQ